MKFITRDTDYAIRALVCMAGRKTKVITVAELSGMLDTPGAYMRGILQMLGKKGVLSSRKGRGGGFSLSMAPEDISVFFLMEIFQGPFALTEHLFRGKKCPKIRTCRLKKKLDGIEKHAVRELRSVSIALIASKGR